MRKWIAVFNDPHSGHRLGLMNPGVVLHREDELGRLQPFQPAPTASQQYLWDLYTKHISTIADLVRGEELTVLLNGDATQGTKHPGHWVSTRISDQILIAAANMAPWFHLTSLRHVRIAFGTEAHNMGEGSSEVLLAELLQKTYPQVDVQLCSHGLLTCNDVVFDYAHHGPHPGNRNWLLGNTARAYLRDLMSREVFAHRRPPDIVLRAHYHTPVHELLEMCDYVSELFVVPSYCMADDFTRQATQSLEQVTNGCVVFSCEDGRFDYQRLYATVDTRTVDQI